MPLKISLDARPLSTPVSGVGRLITETILHFPDKEKYHFFLHSHLAIHKSHEKILDLTNVTFLKGKGILSKKGGIYFSLYLPGEIREISPDLFWGSQQVVPPFLPKSTPVVLTYCDLVLYLFPNTMRKIAALQQRFFQAYSIKRADYVVSISEATRRDFLNKFDFPEIKTGVAYPGVSQLEIKNLLKSEERIPGEIPEKFILSVSTIEPRKNYKFLLEVFKEYRRISGVQKLPWVIVGKIGWEKKEFLDELNSEIRENRDIFLINFSSDVILHKLYEKAEIFLFASLYEGFGIPLLEALAHRKKCLVSDIPTFREIGGSQIPYLPTEKPIEWANKIINLQNNKSFPSIDLEKFSWERSAIQTKDAFEHALNHG